jgi:hypothetical protein
MRSLSGFLLLTAGLTVGAFAYYPGSGPERDLAEITRIMTPDARQSADGVAGSYATTPRLFSPQSPLVALDDPTRLASLDHKPAPAERAKSPRPEDAGAWSTVVTTAPAAGTSAPTTSTSRPRLSSTRPADDASRYELVRDLQRELKRVGCYHGEIDGDWGPGSKRAMSSFIERVNATLPTGDPDYILLMLVQGQTQPACGSGCPNGQVAGEEGRCVPKAIVANAQPRPVVRVARPASEPTPAQAARTPATEEPKSVAPAKSTSPAPAVAEAAPPAPKPAQRTVALAAPSPAATTADPAAPSAVAREPLPGRMTVGAPMPSAEAPALLKSEPKPARRPGKAIVAAVEPAGPSDDTATKPDATSERAAPHRPAKPKRAARPAPRRAETATWVGPPPKKKPSYSYAGGSSRSGSRPGTPRYNLLLSLGGIF